MKSYGRAPSFLTLTGYEQTRSVVAEIAGDHEAAARVELVLPDTGVCGGSGLFDEQAGRRLLRSGGVGARAPHHRWYESPCGQGVLRSEDLSVVGAWIVLCPAPTPSRSTGSMRRWTRSPRSGRSSGRWVRSRELLSALSQLISRAEAERLRVLAVADDIAEETGDRSTAAWLATRRGTRRGPTPRHALWGRRSGRGGPGPVRRWGPGSVNLAQARVIVESLTRCPRTWVTTCGQGRGLPGRAGRQFGPRELRTGPRGAGAPGPRDRRGGRLPAAARRGSGRVRAATRLTMRRRGDGSTDIHARVPDATAGRLSTFLNAYTAPRRRHHTTERLPNFSSVCGVRGSWRCWRTFPPTRCPATAGSRPP